jgi:nifR3 family TIM-barrel protein
MTAGSAPTRVAPLRIGPYRSDTPVVLAPMAGITNAGFRRLCREQGAGFYVCEMITSRGLVERNPLTFRMIAMDPDERPRSMQLYGVDPATVGAAVRMVAERDLADHVDLNFGCPVPKVTRRGGGAALPYKRRLFDRIVRAAVANAGHVPVTVKMRIGIDDAHRTHLEAGRIAVDAGVAAVALHARTAAQRYSGTADWSAITTLRDALPAEVPVLGNGDIFSAADALAMVRGTGCDGVVVGRGCLGRPWLFGDLEAAFAGRPLPPPPSLGTGAATLHRHAVLLAGQMGPDKGIRDLRKHFAWYLKGFSVGPELRRRLGLVGSLDELDELLARLDPRQPFPADAEGPRGRQGSPGRVVLPERWLVDPDDPWVPFGAEMDNSGG